MASHIVTSYTTWEWGSTWNSFVSSSLAQSQTSHLLWHTQLGSRHPETEHEQSLFRAGDRRGALGPFVP